MAFSIKVYDESDVENTSYLQNNKVELKKLLNWIQKMKKKDTSVKEAKEEKRQTVLVIKRRKESLVKKR